MSKYGAFSDLYFPAFGHFSRSENAQKSRISGESLPSIYVLSIDFFIIHFLYWLFLYLEASVSVFRYS